MRLVSNPLHVRPDPNHYGVLCGYNGPDEVILLVHELPRYVAKGWDICPECMAHPAYGMVRLANL